MKEKIYRIQDAGGRGPWRPGFSHKWVRARPDMNLQPWFVDWPKFNPHIEMRSGEVMGTGCRSLEQLRKWFSENEYNTLRILGFRSVEIDGVRILRANNKQAVFACRHKLSEGAKQFDLY